MRSVAPISGSASPFMVTLAVQFSKEQPSPRPAIAPGVTAVISPFTVQFLAAKAVSSP